MLDVRKCTFLKPTHVHFESKNESGGQTPRFKFRLKIIGAVDCFEDCDFSPPRPPKGGDNRCDDS